MLNRKLLKKIAVLAGLALALFSPSAADGDDERKKEAETKIVSGALTGERFFVGESVYLHNARGEDIFAAGGEMIFDNVEGADVYAAGCPVLFSAVVARKLHAAGCQIEIDGAIEEGLVAVGGQVRQGSDAVVGGYAVVAGGKVDLSGEIGGNLNAAGGKVGVFGFVGGDARIAAGEINIGPRARIEGDLEYESGKEPRIAEGAVILGEVRRIDLFPDAPTPDISTGDIVGFALSFWLLATLGFVVMGGAAQLAFPRMLDNAARTVKTRPWACLGLGFALLVATPIAATLAAFTAVGIPLAIVVFAAYVPAKALGLIVAAHWVGCPSARSADSPAPGVWRRLGGTALGMLAAAVVFLIPWLGALVVLLATSVGLGALAFSLRGGRAG